MQIVNVSSVVDYSVFPPVVVESNPVTTQINQQPIPPIDPPFCDFCCCTCCCRQRCGNCCCRQRCCKCCCKLCTCLRNLCCNFRCGCRWWL